MYQAAHHQFVASALAVKYIHQHSNHAKVGAMIAYKTVYPYTCNPKDVIASVIRECNEVYRIRSNNFFISLFKSDFDIIFFKILPDIIRILSSYLNIGEEILFSLFFFSSNNIFWVTCGVLLILFLMVQDKCQRDTASSTLIWMMKEMVQETDI